MSDDSSSASDHEITEEELRKETNDILKNNSNATTKVVFQKLEKQLGTDLSSKKKLIDKLITDYKNNLESSEDEEVKSAPEKEDDSDTEMQEKKKASPIKKEKEDSDSSSSESLEDFKGANTRGRATRSKNKRAPVKGKKGGVKKRGGKGGGYTRAIKLSPELSELVGAAELPRHEVVKRVWAIIKERQLIDPNNRQFAICDKPLYKVIGTQRFYTFGMMKYLKNHFLDG